MFRIAFIACVVTVAVALDTPRTVSAADDVLSAQEAGLVDVKFIPNDSRSAQVVVANRGDRPLTLRLPASFGAVPVLAQQQNNAGMNGNMQNQNVGGGGGGNMNMNMNMNNANCWVAREVYGVHDPRWMLFRDWMETEAPLALQCGYAMHGEEIATRLRDRPVAKRVTRTILDLAVTGRAIESEGAHLSASPEGGPPAFVVYPGRSRVVRVPTVCLEHGKREPNTRVPYRMVRLDTCTSDPRLADVLECLSQGVISQTVAQAASWHMSSGRSWQQLADEVIEMAGGADPDVPVFSSLELMEARRVVDQISRRHAIDPVAASAPGSPSVAP